MPSVRLKCGGCASVFETESHPSVNIASEPELKARVLSGELFVSACPHCGKKCFNTSETLYHDPDSKLMVWLTRSTQAAEQGKALFAANEALHAYTARLVDSVGELIEKVKILDAGLDDIAIEMCKYVTVQELGKKVTLKFLRLDGPEQDLIFTYPEAGEMQMLSVGFNVYEDCSGIVRRNPSLKAAADGFVHVDSEWLSRYIG